MYEDAFVRETPYGRVVKSDSTLLITPDGERFLQDFFVNDTERMGTPEERFEFWINNMYKKLGGSLVKRLGPQEHSIIDSDILDEEDRYVALCPDLMFKPVSFTHLAQSHYGPMLELATLAEIQQRMADNQNELYEFTPHRLYFGSIEFILTDWIEGRNWAQLEIEEYPPLYDAMTAMRKDLQDTGIKVDDNDGNFIYLGKNEDGKPRFGIIDQLDPHLAERLD